MNLEQLVQDSNAASDLVIGKSLERALINLTDSLTDHIARENDLGNASPNIIAGTVNATTASLALHILQAGYEPGQDKRSMAQIVGTYFTNQLFAHLTVFEMAVGR
jgi:hypothetical protein